VEPRAAADQASRAAHTDVLYWELKYQHGELRVQVQRLSGEGPASDITPPPPQPADSFIPLASLKK
jgi:hypothetical protein